MNTQCPSILHHCHPSRNHFDPISLGCKHKTHCCCPRKPQPSALKHSYHSYRGSSRLTRNFQKSGNSCQLPKINNRHFSFMQVHWNGSFLPALQVSGQVLCYRYSARPIPALWLTETRQCLFPSGMVVAKFLPQLDMVGWSRCFSLHLYPLWFSSVWRKCNEYQWK